MSIVFYMWNDKGMGQAIYKTTFYLDKYAIHKKSTGAQTKGWVS